MGATATSGGRGEDALLAAIAPDGQSFVGVRYGTGTGQNATRLATHGDQVVLGGQFKGDIDLGNGPLHVDSSKSVYADDIFLAACPSP